MSSEEGDYYEETEEDDGDNGNAEQRGEKREDSEGDQTDDKSKDSEGDVEDDIEEDNDKAEEDENKTNGTERSTIANRETKEGGGPIPTM